MLIKKEVPVENDICIHLKSIDSLRRKEKFIVLSLIPLYFILIGLFLQPINEIIPGIIRIVREPDVLITDYLQ